MTKPVLLSGIQPSGNLMIGNYIGMLKNSIELQNKYDCLFPLVDLHTITVKQDPNVLRECCYDCLALYIACGIDPEKNTIFMQSHVPAHSELAWILNCYTYMGELGRMTQFKDKSKRFSSNINVGLFDYPVLMAADILLYGTELVTVGGDQKQHMELTRDVAIRFNSQYGDILTVPEPYIPPVGARIMSLQDPDKKMSKSDDNKNNFVALLDEPNVIRKKLKRAVTDSEAEIKFDPENKPGVSNLLTLYSSITDKSILEIEKHYAGQGYGAFKSELGDAMAEFLAPIQEKFREIRDDLGFMNQVLKQGADNARERAAPILKNVQEAVGFIAF